MRVRVRPASLVAPALGVLLSLVPLVARTDITLLNLGFFTFLYIAQGMAWNILGGFAGYVSFGYAAFFGLGAYTTALLWLHGWPPVLTYPVGGAVAAVFSLVVGVPTLRLVGPYFSIATIGVGEAMRVLMLNLDRITGGASGLNLPTVVPARRGSTSPPCSSPRSPTPWRRGSEAPGSAWVSRLCGWIWRRQKLSGCPRHCSRTSPTSSAPSSWAPAGASTPPTSSTSILIPFSASPRASASC